MSQQNNRSSELTGAKEARKPFEPAFSLVHVPVILHEIWWLSKRDHKTPESQANDLAMIAKLQESVLQVMADNSADGSVIDQVLAMFPTGAAQFLAERQAV